MHFLKVVESGAFLATARSSWGHIVRHVDPVAKGVNVLRGMPRVRMKDAIRPWRHGAVGNCVADLPELVSCGLARLIGCLSREIQRSSLTAGPAGAEEKNFCQQVIGYNAGSASEISVARGDNL
jgi:hypothetical protein